MKYGISLSAIVALVSTATFAQSMREETLRNAALAHGLRPAAELTPTIDHGLVDIGALLFDSTQLSLNGDTSCRTCHIDHFGSADGLPVAIGVGGVGEGEERLASGGNIVPRNVLPLWGRGGPGFNLLFWDGRVEATVEGVRSQFGADAPSDNPLAVAAHLPVVEIREMLVDDELIRTHFQEENVSAAQGVYQLLTARVGADPDLGPPLAAAHGKAAEDLTYLDIAEAIAAFIAHEFRMQPSSLEGFVFDGKRLSSDEVQGGLLFYGKGRCASCHTGPYFTDFRFHAIPIPQAGFGRNGFGVDYGRYNVTNDPADLYLFRTPPLWQVARTAPYGHSGGAPVLQHAIKYHFDPLFDFDAAEVSGRDRVEFYRRLSLRQAREIEIPYLSDAEVAQLVAFLRTLSFDR